VEDRREGARRKLSALVWLCLTLPLLYLASSVVVFDFGSVACDLTGWEYDGKGRRVFHGPEPRVRICQPAKYSFPTGAWWNGREWAFQVYKPVCRAWLLLNGYAPAPVTK